MEQVYKSKGTTVYQDGDKRVKQFNTEPEFAEVEERDDGHTYLTVPINGRYVEREGDEFTDAGLQSQIKQLKEGTVPFYFDHGLDDNGMPTYRGQDQVGVFVDGEIRDKNGEEHVFGTIKLRNDEMKEDEVQELLSLVNQGMAVAFSIGFRILEFEEMTDDEGFVTGLRIMDVDLMETSFVGIPAKSTAVITASANDDELDEVVNKVADAVEEKMNISEDNIMGNDNQSDPDPDGDGDDNTQNTDLETVKNTVQQTIESELNGTVQSKIQEAIDEQEFSVKVSEKQLAEAEKEEVMEIIGGVLETSEQEIIDGIEGVMNEEDVDVSDEVMEAVGGVVESVMDEAEDQIEEELPDEENASDDKEDDDDKDMNEGDKNDGGEPKQSNKPKGRTIQSHDPEEENGEDDNEQQNQSTEVDGFEPRF